MICNNWYEDNPNDIEQEVCKAHNRRVICGGQFNRCLFPDSFVEYIEKEIGKAIREEECRPGR